MQSGARHWTALSVLAALTVSTGVSFVFFKASVLRQEPFAIGESTWFIGASNLVPRFGVGVLFLLALHGGRVLKLTRAEWTQGIFMALTSFSGCLFQVDGLQRTSAATTAFLTQFYVILIPIWWAIYHRRRPGWSVILGALLVLAGVAVLARIDWHTIRIGRGEAEVLLAAVFFSLLISSLNWPGFAANRSERTSAAMFLIEGLLFAVVALVTCRNSTNLTAPYFSFSWVWLSLAASVFGTVGPFLLMNRWQRFVTTTEAGLLYSFSPVIAAFSEVFIPAPLSRIAEIDYANQPLSLALVIGGALILGANVLIQLRPPPAPALSA